MSMPKFPSYTITREEAINPSIAMEEHDKRANTALFARHVMSTIH